MQPSSLWSLIWLFLASRDLGRCVKGHISCVTSFLCIAALGPTFPGRRAGRELVHGLSNRIQSNPVIHTEYSTLGCGSVSGVTLGIAALLPWTRALATWSWMSWPGPWDRHSLALQAHLSGAGEEGLGLPGCSPEAKLHLCSSSHTWPHLWGERPPNAVSCRCVSEAMGASARELGFRPSRLWLPVCPRFGLC